LSVEGWLPLESILVVRAPVDGNSAERMETAFVQKHHFFRQLDNLKRIRSPCRPRQPTGLALQIGIMSLQSGGPLLPQLSAPVGKRKFDGLFRKVPSAMSPIHLLVQMPCRSGTPSESQIVRSFLSGSLASASLLKFLLPC